MTSPRLRPTPAGVTRRRATAALAALLAAPRRLRAQGGGVRRIAMLWSGGQPDQVDTVRATLAREGFAEGRTIAIELVELPPDGAAAAGVVEDVLARGVELVLVQGPVAPAVHRAVAQRVPTVVAFSGDPVAAGLVESLRRPGKRTTGVSFLVVELVGKRLELLVELAPSTQRVGVLLNSRHYGYDAELAATRRVADLLKLTTQAFDAREPAEFPAAFAAMTRARVHGIVVFPDTLMVQMTPQIAAFAIRERLPVVAGWVAIARGGALASYGPDLTEAYERVAVQVARILRGDDPSLLPVEQPTRIRTVLNLKTAQALGMRVPPAVVARADEVIR